MAVKLNRIKILNRLKEGDISIEDADTALGTGVSCNYSKSPKGCISFSGLKTRLYLYPEELVKILNQCKTGEFRVFFDDKFPEENWTIDLGESSEPKGLRNILERLKYDEIDIDEALKLITSMDKVISYKRSEKGCVSFYGIRRFPISIYPDDMMTVLTRCLDPDFQEFFADNFPDVTWAGVTEPDE